MTSIFCTALLVASAACLGSGAPGGGEVEGAGKPPVSIAHPTHELAAPLFGPFTFGTWIQPLFELRDWQDHESTVGFRLRRARLIVNGQGLDGRLRFRLMPDLASTPQLRDAWIQLDGNAGWVRMGQQTVPFSLQREVTMARGHFGDRALAGRRFELSGGRDIGVVVGTGTSAGHLRVSAGAFNGRGPNRSDPSPFPLLAARAGVAVGGPVPNGETDLARTPGTVVALGGALMGSRDSFLRPRPGFAADQTADWRSWTIDLLVRSRGLSVTGAWFAQSVTTPPPGESPTSVEIPGEGWYVGAGWLLPIEAGVPVPDMEVVVRHSRARWDLARQGSGERESAIGLTLFHRDHAVQTRLQLTRERGMLTGLSDRSTRLTLEHQLFM